MIRRFSLVAVFALAVVSFVACGDGEGGEGAGGGGGTGGNGGSNGGLNLKPGWCESISLDALKDITGKSLEVGGSLIESACNWNIAEEEGVGGLTAMVRFGNQEIFNSLKEESEKLGVQGIDVDAHDAAWFVPGSDEGAASIEVLVGSRMIYVAANLDISHLDADALLEIVDLVLDAI